MVYPIHLDIVLLTHAASRYVRHANTKRNRFGFASALPLLAVWNKPHDFLATSSSNTIASRSVNAPPFVVKLEVKASTNTAYPH